MSSHRQRYREIAETLSRHGLGYLVGMVGLERHVPFHRGLLGHERRAEPYTRPEHVRLAFEQLGATFVKLGQILSTRSDLLGPEYQLELAKLQDAAPPVPGETIRDLIAQELGQSVEEAFATFEVVPLAAASIGQAHAATLVSGRSNHETRSLPSRAAPATRRASCVGPTDQRARRRQPGVGGPAPHSTG